MTHCLMTHCMVTHCMVTHCWCCMMSMCMAWCTDPASHLVLHRGAGTASHSAALLDRSGHWPLHRHSHALCPGDRHTFRAGHTDAHWHRDAVGHGNVSRGLHRDLLAPALGHLSALSGRLLHSNGSRSNLVVRHWAKQLGCSVCSSLCLCVSLDMSVTMGSMGESHRS